MGNCASLFRADKGTNLLAVDQFTLANDNKIEIKSESLKAMQDHLENIVEKPQIMISSSLESCLLGSDKIPIQEINYDCQVTGTLTNVKLSQVYFNTSNNSSYEVSFQMPIDPSYVVHSLTVTTKDKTVKGKIISRQSAEQKYNIANAAGNQAMLIKEDKLSDLVTLSIGVIEPSDKVTVVIDLSMFNCIDDECWCISLPLRIASSFNMKDNSYSSDIKSKIVVNIESITPITRLLCRSHQPNIIFKDKLHLKANVTLLQESNKNGDFVLIYRFDNMKSPYLLFEELVETKEYAYALSFTPAYCENATAITKMDINQNKRISDDTLQGTGEYIFLLDTSGSMNGDRITMAVDSLKYFIASFPVKSKFNVVLFDSIFNFYYEGSIPYTKQATADTLARIEKENFRFGGTDIYPPLEAIFRQECDPKFPRVLFLITDGGVSDQARVVELIKSNSRYNMVNALGIGSGVDNELIVNSAKAGNGKYRFVNRPDEIAKNVIELLDIHTKPAYVDMSIKWGDASVLEWPKRSNIPSVYHGNQIYICGIFEKKLKKTMMVSFIDTIDLERKELFVGIQNSKKVSGLGKIIAHNCIKDGDESGIGVKYNVLCKETAIYAEIKSTKISKNVEVFSLVKEDPVVQNNNNLKLESISPIIQHLEPEPMLSEQKPSRIITFQECGSAPPKQCLSFPIEDESNKKPSPGPIDIELIQDLIPSRNIISDNSSLMPLNAGNNLIMDRGSFLAKAGLEGVIQQQNTNGLWELNAVCAELCKDKQQIIDAMPDKIKKSIEMAWSTIIMISVLNKKYPGDQAKWKLLIIKSFNMLKSMGIKYADYANDANSLI